MVGESSLLCLVKYQFARIDSCEDSVARAITTWHDTTIGELRYLLCRRRNEGYQTTHGYRSESHTDKWDARVCLSCLGCCTDSVRSGFRLRGSYSGRSQTDLSGR